MTLATNFSTLNMANVDLNAVWSSASVAGTYAENVQPSAPFAAGTRTNMQNGGTAIYCKLSTGGATGQYYCIVAPSSNWGAAVMMSNSVGALGDPVGSFLGSAAAVSGDYGWVQISGTGSIFLNTASANVAMQSTTTAGEVDDASGSGTKVLTNLWLTAANAGSAAVTACEMQNPTVGATN